MKDFLYLIVYEKRTILRGFLTSFVIILPFSFAPILISKGFDVDAIQNFAPSAIVFTICFSLFVVFVAVMQNYYTLRLRKRIFDKPAFRKLEFYGRFLGLGSIVDDLESVLIGKWDHYFYRLRIVDPEKDKLTVEITPLLEDLKSILIKDYLYFETANNLVSQFLTCNNDELENENLLLERIAEMDSLLHQMKAVAFDVNEIDLLTT
jgi:hypothetical protein